jgi:hypothetical protein
MFRLNEEHSDRKQKKSEILEHLLVEVMVDTGPSITITTLTNFLAFAIGILTPTPEIQLFSIGNALSIVLDYVYQVSSYNRSSNVNVFSGQFSVQLWFSWGTGSCKKLRMQLAKTDRRRGS